MTKNLQELIQNDLIALLDGHDENLINNACQIIVDRFKEERTNKPQLIRALSDSELAILKINK